MLLVFDTMSVQKANTVSYVRASLSPTFFVLAMTLRNGILVIVATGFLEMKKLNYLHSIIAVWLKVKNTTINIQSNSMTKLR